MRKKQSMEEIYLENRHWVYGSFLRKTGEIETAEDLSQTLWLRFFQNYENLNLPNEKVVRAYLRSMILHAAADYWRSTQKAEAFPEDAIDDIEAAYRELSEEERLLLSLKYEGRCTSKEIGAVIDRIDQNETETQKHKMVPPRAKSARAYHFLVLR